MSSTASGPSAPVHMIRSFRRLPLWQCFRANKRRTQNSLLSFAGATALCAVRTSANSKLRRPTEAWLQDLSDGFQQFYRIAFVQHAFDYDRTVNARHSIVSLRYFF